MNGLRAHPLRERVLAEMHARPFTPVPTPQRLLHFAFLVTEEEAKADRKRADALSPQEALPDARHLLLDQGRIRWERHGEFVSYTFRICADALPRWPPDMTAPGLLLAAIDLRLVAGSPPQSHLVDAAIADGKAVILTDFTASAEGFVGITICNLAMGEDVAGATVQRVLEIETYRCLALLGLPVAERAATTMTAIENALPDLMQQMHSAASLEDNRRLLDRLTALTLELESSSALTHFRFGATRAYAELVRLRIQALKEGDRGGSGLGAFFSRRFDPAIRACSTVAEREATLARKLTRAAQLLRTRVEIALQSQNRDLLSGMGNRLRLQLRLQQTVEGLSVAAIAYYISSLFHLAASGLHIVLPIAEPELLTAAAVPFIILLVAQAVRRLRHRHREDPQP